MGGFKHTGLAAGTTAGDSVRYEQLPSGSNVLAEGSGGTGTTVGHNGFKNRIINGAMVIDQRNAGASVTPTAAETYTLDRWNAYTSQASKFSVQRNAGSVTPPAGYTNYLGVTSLSAFSLGVSDYCLIGQRIEAFNVADFGLGASGASTFTISFWVRSSLTGTFGGIAGNNSNYSYPFTYTINSANTWEQKFVTIVGPTAGTWGTGNSTGLGFVFSLGAGSSFLGAAGSWAATGYLGVTGQTNMVATNGATFYITGVQLEKGSTATSFDYRPYGTELQLCQRYLPVLSSYSFVSGYNSSGTQVYVPFSLPVPARTAPTGISTSLSAFVYISSSGYAVTALDFIAAGTQTCLMRATTAQALTANNGNMLQTTNQVLFTGCEL
jgi:hypothetical protein